MKNKIKFMFGIAFLLSILLIGFTFAVESTWCCEKTAFQPDGSGAKWCQSVAEESLCDSNFKSTPTSCEQTVYCQMGTCISNNEGICKPNVAKKTCDLDLGHWENKPMDEIPQCQLGCCLMGDQAAYVTQTRCQTLSSIYNLKTDYRRDIQNEIQCLASANPDVKGACVFEENYVQNCKMTTKKECNDMQTEESSTNFHEGFLCSAEELNTICGPKGGTICSDEKVYYLDTCGNLANIYDSSKLNDNNYWTYIVDERDSCDDGQGNKNSKTCGNCDYYSGSMCKAKKESGGSVNYGDYICADLDCEDKDFKEKYGRNPQHGERWCVSNVKDEGKENSPGSESYRLMCYNGEVTAEDCSAGEYRNKICKESSITEKGVSFKTANCEVNRWQDCMLQTTEKECTDSQERDCKWIKGYSLVKDDSGVSLTKDENNETTQASCVPKFAPGFDFWGNDTQSGKVCAQANSICVVEFETGVLGDREKLNPDSSHYDENYKFKHCVKNCECLKGYPGKKSGYKCRSNCGSYEDWISNMKGICHSLGDCGIKTNYLGNNGYFVGEDSMIQTEFFKKKKDI